MSAETVTLVFTDLVGSTELLSLLGERRADGIRREHFGLLRAAVAETGGREVKNLGDGLMVAFDGVGSALACATAMQQAITCRPGVGEPLSIRIGVAVGEAEVEEDDYFGLPVIEAARLCARAEGGEVLTTAFVRMLARSRGGFEFEPIGALELKGLAEPVESFRLCWERIADTASMPMPRRVVALAASTFVGRAAERARLAAAAEAANGGDCRAVLLSGEPGIGKTTLAASFAVDAATRGGTVLYGRCDEDLFVPYQPWVEALGHVAEHAPDEVVAAHVEACGAVLGRIVPELARRTDSSQAIPSSGDPEVDRHLLYGSVVDLLVRASVDAPIVLLLDDLHWADDASTQLLRHVLASSRAIRMLILGTFRDSDIGADHPLSDVLARLHREHGVERIAVRGLDDDELLAMVEAIAGHDLAEDGLALRDALVGETAGNPFFVGELVRHLVDTGALSCGDDGRLSAEVDLRTTGLPVSIREVVGRRVQALGDETGRVLATASVIGRDFELDHVARIVDVDVDHLIDLCDDAVAAAVLRETATGYAFTHALIEYSLYDGLSTNRRARAHQAVAELLEALVATDGVDRSAQLAYHWGQAVRPRDSTKAGRYARQAGDRALDQLAPAEALRWYGEALNHLEDSGEPPRAVLELQIRIGEAQRLTGLASYRDTLVDAAHGAIETGEPDLLVAAALAGDRGYNGNTGTVDEVFVRVVRAALDTLGDDDRPERARLLGLLAVELTWEDGSPDERLSLVSAALAMARRLGDDRTFAEVVAHGDEPRAVPERAAENRRDSAEACAIADRSGSLALRIRARTTAATAALDVADRDAFDESLAALERDAAQVDLDDFEVCALFHRVHAAQLDGDPDATDDLAERYFHAQCRAGSPANAALVASSARVMSGTMRGDTAPAVTGIEQAIVENPGVPPLRALLAFALAVGGRHAEARAAMAADREREFLVPYNEAWVCQAFWAEAAHRVGDAQAAAVLLPRLEPWAHLMGFVQGCFGSSIATGAGQLRRTLGDIDAAVGLLDRAVAIHTALRAPFLLAWSEVALAGALIDRGGDTDRIRATSALDSALEVARSAGYRYVERDGTAERARLTP